MLSYRKIIAIVGTCMYILLYNCCMTLRSLFITKVQQCVQNCSPDQDVFVLSHYQPIVSVLCTVLAIISWHTWLDCSDSEYVVDGVDELQRLASFEYQMVTVHMCL